MSDDFAPYDSPAPRRRMSDEEFEAQQQGAKSNEPVPEPLIDSAFTPEPPEPGFGNSGFTPEPTIGEPADSYPMTVATFRQELAALLNDTPTSAPNPEQQPGSEIPPASNSQSDVDHFADRSAAKVNAAQPPTESTPTAKVNVAETTVSTIPEVVAVDAVPASGQLGATSTNNVVADGFVRGDRLVAVGSPVADPSFGAAAQSGTAASHSDAISPQSEPTQSEYLELPRYPSDEPEANSAVDTQTEAYLSDETDISPAKAAKLARPNTNASKLAHWAGRGLSMVLLASVILAGALAMITRFIPTLWLVVGGVFVALVAAGVTFGLFVARPHIHRKTYAGLSIGAVIGIILSLFAATFLYRLNDFTSTIQPDDGTPITYAVFALKSSELGPDSSSAGTPEQPSESKFDPQLLAGADVALIGADPNKTQVVEAFNEIVSTNLIDYSGVSELAIGLTRNEVLAGVVDTSMLNLYQEHTPDFYNAIEVLFTFDIHIEAKPPAGDANSTTGPFVLFISGIDTWGDLSQTGLSDVNMVVVVNPATSTMLLVNTPRDYYVPLRGHPGLPDKLTHAGVYGVETSVGTIEDLYGIKVDYWMRINFNSVTSIVDSLGGIDVMVTDEFTCGDGYMQREYTFYPGLQHFTGEQALCFARERKSLDGGDRARGKHQQQIIQGVMNKATSPSMLLRYADVLGTLTPHLETSMPATQITAFARMQLERGIRWKIEEVSVDGYDAYAPTYTYGSQELYVMKPVISTVDEAKSRIEAVLSGK